MKNFLPVFLCTCFFTYSLSAQDLQIANSKPAGNKSKNLIAPNTPNTLPNTDKCGFAYIMNRAKKNGYKEAEYESALSQLIQKKITEAGNNFTGPVDIPVVFHVIHRTADAISNSTPNLTAAQYQAQINQLNLDFSNLSGSVYGVAADVQIRFCMALVDTIGKNLLEPGINRVDGQALGWVNTDNLTIDPFFTFFDGTIKPATIWDPYSYFNIWTAAMSASNLLGYATFPGMSTIPGLDNLENDLDAGLVINWESVGSVAAPGVDLNYGLGRTITHEAGHFFGLRHINGDDLCGNDYCNDTPAQDDLTNGCPATGTLNGCTPSVPKMFENYMDYTDDACVNTFTANQALRCQTVMDNSPRRMSLMASKACQPRAGNAIGFSSVATSRPYVISETGNPGACPNTKTYFFNLYINDKATGNATINFSAAGTATAITDFSISPASVTYTNNDASVKTLSVTIADDQAVEALENIIVSYTISGTGVSAAPDRQTITIQIIDNELSVVQINHTTPVQTLLTQNFNAAAAIPAGWSTEIYGDGISTPNEWVVGNDGGNGTSGNTAYVTEDIIAKPNTYNDLNSSDAYLFTPLIDASGLKSLNITFKWRCRGELGYDEGYIGFIPEGQAVTAANVTYFNIKFGDQNGGNPMAATANLNLSSFFDNKKFYFVFNWYNDNSIGTNPGFTIDDIVFTGKAFSVATTADADTSFTQFAGQNVRYYSNKSTAPFESRLIASINGINQDIGCTNASLSITNPGTGLSVLSTTTGIYSRSNKVINVTPPVSNTTASYQATFYFTTAELTAWGASVPNLKILKVADGVNLSSVLTPFNAAIFTPVVDDQRATRGYVSFTINATGGYSQFLLVSPTTAVPVTLISFEAKATAKNIVLNWSTAAEFNNKGFVIERSTNGSDFEKIAWVDGKINSSTTALYQLTDNFVQPGILYYYRLRQTDLDARETLSETRHARISDKSVFITISPNPAKNYISIYTKGSKELSNITLLNAQGQVVKSWQKQQTSTTAQKINISNIPAGIYMLRISSGSTVVVEKLVIH